MKEDLDVVALNCIMISTNSYTVAHTTLLHIRDTTLPVSYT